MRPLVIIENDRAFCGEIRSTLEAAGFDTDCFSEAAAALPALRRRGFSLAILDLGIADTDPFAVCREASTLVPVLAIANERHEDLCVRALESGADDCVARPIAGRELVARIRNILARSTGGDAPSPDEGFRVSIAEMRVRTPEGTHDLTRGETELLALLVHYAPTPLTIVQMASLLSARRATIESRIKSLRRKLGAARLVSRGGFGYQLVDEG